VKDFLDNLVRFLDPYKQSVFYFKTGLFGWLVYLAIVVFIFIHHKSIWVLIVLYNPLLAYPNVLIHSLFGHFMLGPLLVACFSFLPAKTLVTVSPLLLASSGYLSEMVLPLIGILTCLQISGGRYALVFPLYWLSISLFNTGMYIIDFSTQIDQMPFDPRAGDWAFILGKLGLSDYSTLIGNIVIFVAVGFFVRSIWGIFYYWLHMEQYPIPSCPYY